MKSSTRQQQLFWWQARVWKLVGYRGRKIVGEIYPSHTNDTDWVLWLKSGRSRVGMFPTHALARNAADDRLGLDVKWYIKRDPKARKK